MYPDNRFSYEVITYDLIVLDNSRDKVFYYAIYYATKMILLRHCYSIINENHIMGEFIHA